MTKADEIKLHKGLLETEIRKALQTFTANTGFYVSEIEVLVEKIYDTSSSDYFITDQKVDCKVTL